MNAAIETEGLVKKYRNFVAVEGLNLSVPRGSIYGFLGPNGAGKTTTVRLLTGLTLPTAGTATVAGINVGSATDELRRKIGLLDQQPRFYSWMTGREFLNFVGELFGLRGATLKNRVDEVLALTGISDAAHRKCGVYSGGMKQRLGLAQALINEPEILFLDEPASALDPAGRRDVLDIIAGLRGKATVFMSTHILADVERVCDRVAILNRGKLITEATLEDLQNRYAQPVFVLEPEPQQAERIAALVGELERQDWTVAVNHEYGEIRVSVHDVAAASHQMLPLVARHEVALARYERVKPGLEDIFLKLVDNPQHVEATS